MNGHGGSGMPELPLLEVQPADPKPGSPAPAWGHALLGTVSSQMFTAAAAAAAGVFWLSGAVMMSSICIF